MFNLAKIDQLSIQCQFYSLSSSSTLICHETQDVPSIVEFVTGKLCALVYCSQLFLVHVESFPSLLELLVHSKQFCATIQFRQVLEPHSQIAKQPKQDSMLKATAIHWLTIDMHEQIKALRIQPKTTRQIDNKMQNLSIQIYRINRGG